MFVRDRQFAETTRVSVTSHGAQAHCASPGICSSSHPAISADGRFVAFVSSADNLVGQHTNGIPEVFAHDVLSGATVLASQSSAGAPGNEGATEGYEGSDPPAISATGRFVAFESASTNLVAGDTNRITDVFVRDLLAATTIRVSVAADGSQGVGGNCGDASISADGRFVAFPSGQSNLVPGDTNGTGDVFVRDRVTGQIVLVSKPSTGEQSNGPAISAAISADGRRVAYDSLATNLVPGDTNHAPDVFVADLAAGRTTRVSVASDGTQGNGLGSSEPAISRDGRIVAFQSGSSNLIPGDTNSVDDVFIHEMTSKRTIRLSVASDGRQANSFSWNPTVAVGGRMIGYESLATNLVDGDTNGAWDVFVGTLRLSRYPPVSSGRVDSMASRASRMASTEFA